ncbi:NUDIX hydrolase [Paenibacillus allorhizosphaerae]|uniref:Nudix hydrolase domain-containing protein n=1 Tax=Paenibacillus allorhizosphaerae TaxID=2849866 RepID=A0ABM8VE32_9BACL|nr:NUDIX hydrolase [Paenibacillus allorhizosphaerae]CAG7629870.1 hypothetical protein PAECIP111802_01597 [Paenibacillus allorhizosphaerae]
MANRSCAAIVNDGMILMVRQTYKDETFWTFPGGRIEAGESPSQCAIRETKEETELEIEITDQVCEYFSAKINGTYYCYFGKIIGGTAQLGSDPELGESEQELVDLQWFPVNEVADHPEVKRVLTFLETGSK